LRIILNEQNTVESGLYLDNSFLMLLKKIAYYLNPRNLFKREKVDLNLRFMHGINKISILMFLVCLVVMVVRWISRS